MITVRRATLPGDLLVLLAVHNENRSAVTTLEQLEWRYMRNPAGQAAAWLAIDESTGRAVGCGAAFPRRLVVNGRRVLGWVLGDLSVSESHRGQGVASQLRAATRAEADAGGTDLFYGHPNRAALHVHERLGHVPLGRFVRETKLLSVPGGPSWLRHASALVLRAAGLEPRLPDSTTVDVVPRGSIDVEFDELFDRVAPTLGVAVERGSRYLRWRYHEVPHENVTLLGLRRGRLRAYLAYSARGGYFAVKDWLAETTDDVASIFGELVREARRNSAAWVSATVLEGHPDTGVLRRMGFFRRQSLTAAIAYCPPGSPLRDTVTDRGRWFMTVGDRDV